MIAEIGRNASHIAWILGVFIVLGCLLGAAFTAYRRDFFAACALCVVAVVAAVLLL